MNSPTAIRTRLRRNGTLQPQARNCFSGSEVNVASAAVDNRSPAGTPSCGQLEVAIPLRGVLDRHQSGTAPFASHRETLHESQHDQAEGRQNAHLFEGGQHADQERRSTHDQQRDHQHRFAADPIAEVPEDHSADGSREESHAERGERRKRACYRIEMRKEQLREHQCSGGAVQEEVVPLNGGADEAREGYAADGGPRNGLAATRCCHAEPPVRYRP